MAGPEGAEVAVVQRGQLGLVEPLHNRQDRGVHKPHIGVSIPVTELADAAVVLGLQLLYTVGPGNDVIQKGEEDSRVKAGMDQPVHFDQDRGRNNQRLRGVPQKVQAPSVLVIVPVEGGVKRPCVQN
jgi:hypothetical protein